MTVSTQNGGSYELATEDGHTLLHCTEGKSGGVSVTLLLTNFVPLMEESTKLEDGVFKVVDFLKQLKTLKAINVILPTSDDAMELCTTVGLPVVQAYEESPANTNGTLRVALDVGLAPHLDFLAHCKDSATALIVAHREGANHWDDRAKKVLESLTKLGGLAMTAGCQFPFLSTCQLAPSCQGLGLSRGTSLEEAQHFVHFLKEKPQIDKISAVHMEEPTHEVILNTIAQTSGLQLKTFLFSNSKSRVTPEFPDLLANALANLSPCLERLFLTITIPNNQEDAHEIKTQLKQKVKAALSQNKQLLALKEFRFQLDPPDEELSQQCRAFAVQKTIARSAANRLPTSLLTTALTQIWKHPDLSQAAQQNSSANLMFQTLQNHSPEMIL